MTNHRAATLALALLMAAVGLAQAPPQQTPVFRGGTAVVPLTVTVLDAAPKYVNVVVYDYGSDRAGSYMLTIK